jgi:hypothetical protein
LTEKSIDSVTRGTLENSIISLSNMHVPLGFETLKQCTFRPAVPLVPEMQSFGHVGVDNYG